MMSNIKGKRLVTTVLVMVVSIAMLMGTGGVSASAVASGGSHCAVLKVPSQYPTIQKAINAAHSCDTILVAPGTYVEQLTIGKSITILGSGAGNTIITSPAPLTPDIYGNPWTIELGNAAKVALSGFTLLVTLQCIQFVPGVFLGAGGGIGVGGSAYLTLNSAVVTTTGGTEGASCSGGVYSYGTGVDFGLDYGVGSPPASALLGFGTVSGVTVSGFGFLGPGIGVGGLTNSPAGSSAVISKDKVSSSGDDVCPTNPSASIYPLCIPAVLVTNGGSATIVRNYLTGLPGYDIDAIDVVLGGSAYIAYNSIVANTFGNGVGVYFSGSATILYNTIVAGTNYQGGFGIFLADGASATISYNTIGNFECAYNSTLVSGDLCGPSYATQFQAAGIFNDGFFGLGTIVETNNLIFNVDGGIWGFYGCSSCVVTGNVILNSYDYGLVGLDGSFSYGPNWIIGGAYGVAAIAFSANTTVALSNVPIVGPSVAPFYYEVDFPGGTATITGT